ncbi:LacI family DNA-binding transcriptional regulator [Alkaliphilus serpentinus]|uniref:LacI family transcriptional regulator n=1 Tax=Alkaliphilus serpentinus TaxID=1482731 RepID=A0A833HLL0_9FIRM|nr:LacI family DNA-binding transcriptional regulator [Alkaliphilus serpentinus]KAB3526226.1 LacI family transcriptional regulator [Alkaliphilus serpentinus]
MKKITIKDVARESGVSIAAVSYVLNGKFNKVSDETIRAVKEAAENLNYVPDFSARSLVKNKSMLIGVIIPQTEENSDIVIVNPFYSDVLGGIETKARENGYHILLSRVERGRGCFDVSMQRNLDGAIILGAYEEDYCKELSKVKMPVVFLDSYVNNENFYMIGIDDLYGGYIATKHLIANGHEDIAIVTGKIKNHGVMEKRFHGYKKALEEAGIPFRQEYVYSGSVNYEYGIAAGNEIVNSGLPVTAIFATADIIAFGAINSLKAWGKQIPEDYSIIGFDDLSITRMFTPPLTTVRQDIAQKGMVAADLLIDILEGRNKKGIKEMTLSLNIVERATVCQLTK